MEMDREQKNQRVQDNEIVITIGGTGNHFEDLDDFQESYYKHEYIQAMKIVNSIVGRKEDDSKKEDPQKEEYTNQEISNIISFIGERGTGKTSAVLSFAAALKDYGNPKKNHRDGIFGRFRDRDDQMLEERIQFICLDCIDGSLLEQGEDIFKIILAQMYNKFLDYDSKIAVKESFYENDRRKLQKRFDQLYRYISEMEQGGRREWEQSALTSLRNLSNSMKLKKEFTKLVCDYLKLTSEGRNSRRERQFLVVVVDDLDLNIEHGFDMLEKIHRYMMVPRVIVLLALDFKQLKRLCYKHFFEMIPKVDGIMSARGADAEKLAQDFIDKVLPTNMRVFMPALWKKQTLKVREKEEDKTYPVKQSVFLEMYRKTGIRFDVGGVKRHFYEPGNLRELTNLLLELRELEPLFEAGRDESDILEISTVNHEQIFYDVQHRIAERMVIAEYEKMFQNLIQLSVERSCRKFVEYGRRQKNRTEEETAQMKDFLKDIDQYGYSYGELLRLIYCWGRTSDEAKEFMRSMLAYYSLTMTSLYARYQCCSDKDSEKRENLHGKILEIMNGSFAGSWAHKMFPAMKWEDKSNRQFKIAAVQNMDLHLFKFELKNDSLKREDQRIELLEEDEETQKEEVKKIFRTVIAICMFFTQPYYKTMQSVVWDFECENEADKKVVDNIGGTADPLLADTNDKSVKIHNKSGSGDFNFFNFVINVFDYRRIVTQIENSLNEIFFNKELAGDKRISVIDEFEQWEEDYGNMVMPIYDVDLIYNVMKRIRQKMYSESVGAKTGKELIDYFLYLVCDVQCDKDKRADRPDSIAAMLLENDKFYEDCFYDDSEKQWNNRLYDTYKDCPIIRWFSDLYKKKSKNTMLLPDFYDIFESLLKECSVWKLIEDSDNIDKQNRTFDE